MNKVPGKSYEYWPHCFYFAIFDGHGGTGCANFLRDNLHTYIVDSEYFPKDPKKALYAGIIKAENEFLKLSNEE